MSIEPARINRPRIAAPENTVYAEVLAFDPGGVTGWCHMTVPARLLIGGDFLPDGDEEKTFWKDAETAEWELYIGTTTHEIDCKEMTFADAEATVKRHNGLTIMAENRGIDEMLHLALEDYPTAVIVMEDFILDFKKADMKRETLSPIRLTSGFSFGLFDATDSNAAGERIFLQGRSNVKTTCTDERLKNWGLYDRYSGGHARDAVRHAFYFLRGCRGGSWEACEKRWRAWPHLFQDPYEMETFKKQNQNRSKTKEVVKKLGERIHL